MGFYQAFIHYQDAAVSQMHTAPMQIGAIKNCGIAALGDAIHIPLDH
jgi:hypothetical protein